MFSAEQITQITFTAGFSRAMACIAPIIAAAPAMSYFIFSMPSAGLMEMPPVSNVMPFADETKHRTIGRSIRRLVGHHDQRRRLCRAFRHCPERAHLQFLNLLGDCRLRTAAPRRRTSLSLA